MLSASVVALPNSLLASCLNRDPQSDRPRCGTLFGDMAAATKEQDGNEPGFMTLRSTS